MTSEIITTYCDDCDTNYKAATGNSMENVGLDPITIITAILAILAQICPKPAAALKEEATANSPGTKLGVRFATRLALREKKPGFFSYAKYNGDAIADSIITATAAADSDKMQTVLTEVFGQ